MPLNRLQGEGTPRVALTAFGKVVIIVAKNTGKGYRAGAVKSRSEFKRGSTWFKRDADTGRIMNGSPSEHKGVRNEKS